MKNWPPLKLCVCLLFLILSACAQKTTVVTVVPSEGRQVIAIRASNFSLIPMVIRAHHGDHLLLQVTNAVATAHNLTIKNPTGDVVRSVDLGAGESVEIPLDLTEGGTWKFFCNKPLHETLGMSGRIEVIQ
ncbi:MAG: cupredoxin domain-containing protein [Pedobacter sp.]